MAKKKKAKEELKIKPRPRIRVPHKPTRVHKDSRQYSRKGKKTMQELLKETEGSTHELNKYSLWLMPEGQIYHRLHGLISELSKKYSTPSFEPHVTLIGELVGHEDDIAAKTSQLASIIRPQIITLTEPDYLDDYFRCLFMRVNETDDIMSGNKAAREIFKTVSDKKYMPHLSLMYGNIEAKTKAAIITEIGSTFDVTFHVHTIHLFSTDGDPKDWHRLSKFLVK